ncbi:MAG: hypothetical protein AAGE01_24020 [Pseudomonadota bacterium]
MNTLINDPLIENHSDHAAANGSRHILRSIQERVKHAEAKRQHGVAPVAGGHAQ